MTKNRVPVGKGASQVQMRLAKVVYLFARAFDNLDSEEEASAAFEGRDPIINEDGLHEFLLDYDKKSKIAVLLLMSPADFWIKAVDNKGRYAEVRISNQTFAAKWVRKNFDLFGI